MEFIHNHFILSTVFIGITIWVLGLWLCSCLCNWGKLSSLYRCDEEIYDRLYRFQVASVGLVNFNGMFEVGLSDHGVYMRPVVIFRLFFPPLLIPWSNLELCKSRTFFGWESICFRIKGFRQPEISGTTKAFKRIKDRLAG